MKTANSFHADRPIYGMLIAFIAFALFAAMQMCAKLLAENGYHVIEIAFFRNGIGFIGLFLWLYIKGKTNLIFAKNPLPNMVRGLIGTVGLWLTFAAFTLMPMSETTVFLFSSSLMLPVMAVIFFKDHIGIYRWISILAGFGGVALMAQPSGQVTLYGAIIALLAASMHASAGIMLRHLGKTEHSLTIVFYFVAVGTFFSALALPFFWKTPDITDILLIIGVALAGTMAQISLTIAYKYAAPAQVAPLNYTGLLWAVLFDFLIWTYTPGWPVFTGGAIVIACNLFILYRERKAGKSLLKHQTMA